MNNEVVVREWLALLRTWQRVAEVSAIHIATCRVCITAELNGGHGYCSISDEVWMELMQTELNVMAIIPELQGAGIDVEKDCREHGFQFMAGRATQ
jgi:hypothetical protein